MATMVATLDRIRDESRQVDLVKVLLTLVAALPFILGWVAVKVFIAACVVLRWVVAATLVGWQAGAGKGP